MLDLGMLDLIARRGGWSWLGKDRLPFINEVFARVVRDGWAPRSPAFGDELERLDRSYTRGTCIEPVILAGDDVYIDREMPPQPGDIVSFALSSRGADAQNSGLPVGQSRWSAGDPTTGAISPRRVTSSDPEVIRFNTPAGCVAIEGVFDPLSQRVDLETKQVVDWQPPQPSADHEWNSETRRWVKRVEVIASEVKRAQARAQIEALEVKQMRPLRELLVDPNDTGARARLQSIDAEIAALRRDLLPAVEKAS
ncbi:MAG: hypothetical protein IRZ28_13210 [Steroidobacteraceae bacterium]|nr:hypothetical protein [Steroidobacteraceae bacterium]